MIIREMRTELGDTQSEFATRYNIPFRTIQNWETGVRKPPEYIIELLGQRARADLANRRTVSLPKYDPKKQNLPKRRDFLGSVAWLKAVQACLGEEIVFALDEALMCQGIFGGRSDEYIAVSYTHLDVYKRQILSYEKTGEMDGMPKRELLLSFLNLAGYPTKIKLTVVDSKMCIRDRFMRQDKISLRLSYPLSATTSTTGVSSAVLASWQRSLSRPWSVFRFVTS